VTITAVHRPAASRRSCQKRRGRARRDDAAHPSYGVGRRPRRRAFLLPLPPGIAPDALELFGFWTYEFRVGHGWSTAQGRFGRPLRVADIQHPPPHLVCTIFRSESGITVTAPYATTLLDGQPALDLRRGDPQTALWFLLYAQVTQTDGTASRNVLIDGLPVTKVLGQNREPRGPAVFAAAAIGDALGLLGLPANSPLSVLAVEILPGPIRNAQSGLGSAATGAAVAVQESQLGADLGLRRILRTSPLTAVPKIC
jgi:hypothetical protein